MPLHFYTTTPSLMRTFSQSAKIQITPPGGQASQFLICVPHLYFRYTLEVYNSNICNSIKTGGCGCRTNPTVAFRMHSGHSGHYLPKSAVFEAAMLGSSLWPLVSCARSIFETHEENTSRSSYRSPFSLNGTLPLLCRNIWSLLMARRRRTCDCSCISIPF